MNNQYNRTHPQNPNTRFRPQPNPNQNYNRFPQPNYNTFSPNPYYPNIPLQQPQQMMQQTVPSPYSTPFSTLQPQPIQRHNVNETKEKFFDRVQEINEQIFPTLTKKIQETDEFYKDEIARKEAVLKSLQQEVENSRRELALNNEIVSNLQKDAIKRQHEDTQNIEIRQLRTINLKVLQLQKKLDEVNGSNAMESKKDSEIKDMFLQAKDDKTQLKDAIDKLKQEIEHKEIIKKENIKRARDMSDCKIQVESLKTQILEVEDAIQATEIHNKKMIDHAFELCLSK
ncbi:hypothetical protein EIN_051590 [Entamoeba invadens IP1]|uniref:hypothetical protein n=1 Tax=Entamoeba invadens IP1 TaxID=370355 RepID=UPI0002C3D233|nr:hypothetical protein EIN_051590 [Entamoeba invadens IP1]ELP92994.1 hypothetical protein EIN_051590 [Entamoeba invadens IP1]|eukprot:XP_004259765.1 hypothetical protein EIN_051590 [Entamoeba invadens IP1]